MTAPGGTRAPAALGPPRPSTSRAPGPRTRPGRGPPGVDHDAEDPGFRGPAARPRPGRRRWRRRARRGWCRRRVRCRPRCARNVGHGDGLVVASRTTGASSSSTPSRTAARSVSGPARSHSDVAPPSRSTSASSLTVSGPRRRAPRGRRDHRVPWDGRRPDLGGERGVPSGLTAMPSRVVRLSLAHTASSGSSSRSRPALRSTSRPPSPSRPGCRGSASTRERVPWAGSSSVGSARPPSTGHVRGHACHSRRGPRPQPTL